MLRFGVEWAEDEGPSLSFEILMDLSPLTFGAGVLLKSKCIGGVLANLVQMCKQAGNVADLDDERGSCSCIETR